MPVYKCVFTFISPGTGGGRWSEVYYRSKASLAEAAAFSPATIDARLFCLISLNTLTKIRVSQVDSPRVTTMVNVNRKGGIYDPADNPENTGESHVISLASSARPATRKLWMRGAKANSMFRDIATGDWEISAAFKTRIDTWIAILASDEFGGVILARKKTLGDGVIVVDITRVNGTAANGTSVITLANAPGLIAGNSVAISGVNDRKLPGLNGSYRVISTTGLTVTIAYTVPGDLDLIPEKGTLKKLDYFDDARINAAISGWSYGGVRQTKNDFTGSVGASRRNRTRR